MASSKLTGVSTVLLLFFRFPSAFLLFQPTLLAPMLPLLAARVCPSSLEVAVQDGVRWFVLLA